MESFFFEILDVCFRELFFFIDNFTKILTKLLMLFMFFLWPAECIDVASDVGDNLCNVENEKTTLNVVFFYIVAFFITSILICTLF